MQVLPLNCPSELALSYLVPRTVYRNLGPEWATTILACIATVMAVLPFIFYSYGSIIRGKSRYAQRLLREGGGRDKVVFA
jgi:hypothetical protein